MSTSVRVWHQNPCRHCYSPTPFICGASEPSIPMSPSARCYIWKRRGGGKNSPFCHCGLPWKPIQTKTVGTVFLESCQWGNWPEYFLGRLTRKSTRRSCRAGHFIMSTLPLPLGSDNPMAAAFISIFQPLLSPWHIVTTEQIRHVSAVHKWDLNVTLTTSM